MVYYNSTSEWLNGLPENPIKDPKSHSTYNEMVLDAIESGLVVCEYSEVTSTIPGHTAIFYVNTDACHIILDADVSFTDTHGVKQILPEGSRFRFEIDAATTQKAADQYGNASMVTVKIMDLRHHQAPVKHDASILPAGPLMSTMNYCKNFNKHMEDKRAGYEGVVTDCAKPWILDNQLKFSAGACLYGFFAEHGPDVSKMGDRLWQMLGSKHAPNHCDYSSVLLLMKQICLIDGVETSIFDVMSDPVLSHLINYDGVLKYTRMP